MRAIGIVEAKTKLAQICARVVKRHESVTITKRGRPLVRIEPVANGKHSVWQSRATFLRRGGKLPDELSLPVREMQPTRPLLDA